MIVRLMGGLGNQLFQYAFGVSVAAMRQEPVWFSSRFAGDRSFMLDAFVLDVPLTEHETQPEFHESDFTFSHDVYKAPRGATFVGYWQTELYFVPELLRKNLLLRKPVSPRSAEVAAQIWEADNNSVFIHVRRGDYLIGATNAYHGTLGSLYYSWAIEDVRKACTNAKFFVFSDDPAWCKSEFPSDFTIVEHNGGAPAEDLWLMSQCRHAIIANSSFSWWGAWFGDHAPGRVVVAPKKWFNAPVNTRDLIPPRWLLV